MKYNHALIVIMIVLLSFCGGKDSESAESCGSPNCAAFLESYRDIAEAAYGDALHEAQQFRTALNTIDVAAWRTQWTRMRIPYLQTEVFRFSGTPVDNASVTGGTELEGQLNAWPLDESKIGDYLANTTEIPYTSITRSNILANNGAEGEDDVKVGYHAIEYILWGPDDTSQDGSQPLSIANANFSTAVGETAPYRRYKYLVEVTDQLVADLQTIHDAWVGSFGDSFVADPDRNVKKVLTGLTTLVFFEVGSERLIGLSNNSQEDEHSCFSDTTIQDFYYDLEGIRNVIAGTYSYSRSTGPVTSVASGTGLKDLFSDADDGTALLNDAERTRDAFTPTVAYTAGGYTGRQTLQQSVTFTFEELIRADFQSSNTAVINFYYNTAVTPRTGVRVDIVALSDDFKALARELGYSGVTSLEDPQDF